MTVDPSVVLGKLERIIDSSGACALVSTFIRPARSTVLEGRRLRTGIIRLYFHALPREVPAVIR